LPGSGFEGRVRGRGDVLHGEEHLDASCKFDVLDGKVQGDLLLLSTCCDCCCDVVEVTAVALADTPFSVLERSGDLGCSLLAVLAGLVSRTLAHFEVRSEEAWALGLDSGESDFVAQLHVALPVYTRGLWALLHVDDDVLEKGIGEPDAQVSGFERCFFRGSKIVRSMKEESKAEVTRSHCLTLLR